MRQFDISRCMITPATPMGELLLEVDRRSDWAALGDELGWRLPPLRRPAWMTTAWFGITLRLFSFSFGICLMKQLPGDALAAVFWLDMILVVLGLWIALLLTRALAVHFPPNCTTVRDFIETSLTRNYGVIGKQSGHAGDRPEILKRLRQIISEQMGIPEEKLTEETSFVDDLAMD
jgi:hypothetical protein